MGGYRNQIEHAGPQEQVSQKRPGWLEQALRPLYTWERGKDTDQFLYFEFRILDEISRGATKRMEIEPIFQTSKSKIRNWGGRGRGELS